MTAVYTPIDNRVLVEVVRPSAETVGGIFIPESAQEISAVGIVLARGPLAYEAIIVGARVLFHPLLVDEAWDEDGKRLAFMLDDNVYAVIADAYDGTGKIPDTLPGTLLSDKGE
jgi:co-chaperonin GroES (HSP10)